MKIVSSEDQKILLFERFEWLLACNKRFGDHRTIYVCNDVFMFYALLQIGAETRHCIWSVSDDPSPSGFFYALSKFYGTPKKLFEALCDINGSKRSYSMLNKF